MAEWARHFPRGGLFAIHHRVINYIPSERCHGEFTPHPYQKIGKNSKFQGGERHMWGTKPAQAEEEPAFPPSSTPPPCTGAPAAEVETPVLLSNRASSSRKAAILARPDFR